MPEVATGQMMATELLAMLIGITAEKFKSDIGGSEFREMGDTGISATLHLPPDDAYDITINWLGHSSDILEGK